MILRRSASATTNNWVRCSSSAAAAATSSAQQTDSTFAAGQSPPSRDRPSSRTYMPIGRQLQAPALIAECSERLERSQAGAATHWS